MVVYNPQSWDRTDLVTAEVSSFSLPSQMVAVHGDEVTPVQILKPATRSGARETATVAFLGQDVPQMGLKLYRIVPSRPPSRLLERLSSGGLETAAVSGK